MFMLPKPNYWTTIINLIINKYFLDSITVCIITNKLYEFDLELNDYNEHGPLYRFIFIDLETLNDSLKNDVYDFKKRAEILKKAELEFDDLTIKLTASLESSYCEAFIVFEKDIPKFLRSYYNASHYADWTSVRHRYVFIYSTKNASEVNLIDNYFLKDQARILIIEAASRNSSIFDLKTNRFIGSEDSNSRELYLLNTYDAHEKKFLLNETSLYPNKIKNLKGRKLILGAFDYRPFIAVDYDSEPQLVDHALNNPSKRVRVDGSEARLLFTFCQMYNCTVEIDSSPGDWGYVYPNMTGYGFRVRLVQRQVDMTLGANYQWITPYIDHSHYIGYSTITLMVPKAEPSITWDLPLRPFQFALWLGVVGYLVIEAISLLFTRNMEQYIGHGHGPINWSDSLTYGYSTTLKLFISQNSDYVVTSMSLRLLLFACYMNDIIITSIYGGGLASVLTLPILGEAPDSIERVLKYKLSWAGTSTVWTEAYSTVVPGTQDAKVVALYRADPNEELQIMASTGFFGFVIERTMYGYFGNVDFLTPVALERLKLMEDNLYTEYTVCFVPRNWAAEEHLNEFILAWHAGGFGGVWEWKTVAEFMSQNVNGRIQQSLHAIAALGPEKLDMSHFAGIILLYIVGMLVSIIGFAMERVYFERKLRKA